MPTHLQGQMQLSKALSATAQKAFVLEDLATITLISLSQLCDDDYIAFFTIFSDKIIKNNQVVIVGKRDSNGLWSVPLTPDQPTLQANGILRLDKTKQQLAMYYHATLGSPARSTLLRAIRQGHLVTLPGLTTQLISKHLPLSIDTALGHQDQESRGLCSTHRSINSAHTVDSDISPIVEPKTHNICSMLVPTSSILKSYSDQTGKFPTISSRGNHYIFVLYNYDNNSIHATALPNRQAASIRNAWELTYKILVAHGHPTKLHILDNECSQDLKDAFQKYAVPYQRVPPKEHRANSAERAIRTFKNHFVSILSTVDSNFPISEGDRLLPQTILALNLLRSSRIHPSLLAHASTFGNFDYNRTPLAPPGTQVVAHSSADSRTTFGPHGRIGWYIGPSLEHYRYYKIYFPDTFQKCDVLKVDFSHKRFPFHKSLTITI